MIWPQQLKNASNSKIYKLKIDRKFAPHDNGNKE
jgi:hypothetical protein